MKPIVTDVLKWMAVHPEIVMTCVIFLCALSWLWCFIQQRKKVNGLRQDQAKALVLDKRFLGKHFLVVNLFQKKQWPSSYDGQIWILEAVTEDLPSVHLFEISEKQYGEVKEGYKKAFILKNETGTDPQEFYFAQDTNEYNRALLELKLYS
jgi:hypothetical protein